MTMKIRHENTESHGACSDLGNRLACGDNHGVNTAMPCPFCQLPPERVVGGNEHGLILRDAYPVSPGHTLIIPRRHMGSFFELTPEERDGLLALLDQAREALQNSQPKPDGYNIGINDGPAAGQTVPHLHIHLIPRYAGDMADPRGGVRWVMAEKARYW
jgi:diadenosine tetraphosphate (Ap4A) HIT family hydrolase